MKTARPIGRPSCYTDEIGAAICDRLMDGRSLVQICTDEDMPSRRTVLYWMEKDAAFCAMCARARTLQADLMDDMIRDLIDSVTPETAAADRVKLAAMQWRAAKLAPKKYGDRTSVDLATPDGPLQVEAWKPMMAPEVVRAIGAMLSEAEAAVGLPKPQEPTSDAERLQRILATGEPVPPELYGALASRHKL
jgi:hypothetical protein